MIGNKTAAEEATYLLAKTMKYNMSPIRFTLGMWALNAFGEYRDLKRRIKEFRRVFGEKIQERMKEISNNSSENTKNTKGKRRDLLQILLEHRINHNNDPKQTLSDKEILDQFAVFYLAGKDTTSLLVSMCLYCYTKYPEYQNLLKQEVRTTITDITKIDHDLLNTMNYLSAFMNEVLRVYPPAPGVLPRVVNKDHYVGDFLLKKGYLINTLFIANNYNPKYFQAPEKFDPSRWLKNDKKEEGWKQNHYSYLPFSAGPRNCIGKHLGLMEAKVILSLIIKNFDVEMEEGFELSMGMLSIGYGPNRTIPLSLIPLDSKHINN